MEIERFFLAVILIAGIAIAAYGINIYRYCVVAMSGAGGFMLGRIVCAKFLSNVSTEGVLRDSNVSAMDSFVLAVFVLGGLALGYALYNIMGPLVAAVGGGFAFSKLAMAFGIYDLTTNLVIAAIGGIIGAVLGAAAVTIQRWPLIIFTAVSGARMASYAGAYFLKDTGFGPGIAKPLVGLFSSGAANDAVRMALSLELFIIVAVIGIIIQAIVRDD